MPEDGLSGVLCHCPKVERVSSHIRGMEIQFTVKHRVCQKEQEDDSELQTFTFSAQLNLHLSSWRGKVSVVICGYIYFDVMVLLSNEEEETTMSSFPLVSELNILLCDYY